MDRAGLVFLAKLTEQAERYEEMVQHVRTLALIVEDELTAEERNLLAHEHVERIRDYRQTIEIELQTICEDILEIMTTRLLPKAESDEGRIFLYKTQGDYLRYLAEVQVDDVRKVTAAKALEAYNQAAKRSMTELPPTHPLRLGLALNFSVFYYEILSAPENACGLAKRAFDDAIAELDTLSEQTYRDSTLVMQLLRDNLTLWTCDQGDDGDDIVTH